MNDTPIIRHYQQLPRFPKEGQRISILNEERKVTTYEFKYEYQGFYRKPKSGKWVKVSE